MDATRDHEIYRVEAAGTFEGIEAIMRDEPIRDIRVVRRNVRNEM